MKGGKGGGLIADVVPCVSLPLYEVYCQSVSEAPDRDHVAEDRLRVGDQENREASDAYM